MTYLIIQISKIVLPLLNFVPNQTIPRKNEIKGHFI